MASAILTPGSEEEETASEILKKKTLSLEELEQFKNVDFPTNVVTSRFKRLFSRFNISTDFLHQNLPTWKEPESYQKGLKIFGSLKVVNDVAERLVKLMEEFNSKITKNEEQKQYLLKVVQDYRKKYPGYSKAILNQ